MTCIVHYMWDVLSYMICIIDSLYSCMRVEGVLYIVMRILVGCIL